MKLVLAVDMVAMVKLLLGKAKVGRKSLASYGNVDYGKGVAGYSHVGYGGKGLAGCSSGSHTYNTSTPTGGESNKGLPRCNVTLSVRTRSSPHPKR